MGIDQRLFVDVSGQPQSPLDAAQLEAATRAGAIAGDEAGRLAGRQAGLEAGTEVAGEAGAAAGAVAGSAAGQAAGQVSGATAGAAAGTTSGTAAGTAAATALMAARSITGGGLATGGGTLAADRVITVTEATQADAEAGTMGTVAMTPRRWLNAFNIRTAAFTRTLLLTVDQTAFLTALGAIPATASSFIQLLTGAVSRALSLKVSEIVSPEDFGAVGNGVANDAPALIAAIATGRPIRCAPNKVYAFTASLGMFVSNVDIDLNGSTLKPVGAVPSLNSSLGAAAATTTISSGANAGSISVVVASATGLAVGQIVRFSTNDPTHAAVSYPPSWTEIIAIAGTTVTLDKPLVVTYPGAATTTMEAFAAVTFKNSFSLRNGTVDGSASTYVAGSGGAFRAQGFRSVRVRDVVVSGFRNTNVNNIPVEIFENLTADVELRVQDCMSGGHFVDIQTIGVAQASVTVDGSGFGINFVRCDIAQLNASVLRGRAKDEVAGVALGASTRGVKFFGVGFAQINGLTASDYDSCIKHESSFRYNFNNITLFNAGKDVFSIGVNISSVTSGTNLKGGTITGLNASNMAGVALAIQSDGGECVVDGFNIKDTTGQAIYISPSIGAIDNIMITNGIIENWDTLTAGREGIYATKAPTIRNVRFLNTDNTRICIRAPLAAGTLCDFGGLVAVNGNPLFSGSLGYDTNGTATIASGTTSIVVTHGLLAAPAASDITLTPTGNPAADPGNVWASSIGATQFTINCRTDPGGGGAAFAWRAALKMPFTA